jgi:hypothetical protein
VTPVISETAIQRRCVAETSIASQTAWTAIPSAKLGVAPDPSPQISI